MAAELFGWTLDFDKRARSGKKWNAERDGEKIYSPTCNALCNRIRAMRYAYENRNRFRKQRHR